jgi:lysyl-tRNA synthetase class II
MISFKSLIVTVITGILISNVNTSIAVTSDELINKAKEYDKKEVIYTGEVIGDIMKRGDYAWINVSDENNAIGIWMDYENVLKITYTGKYDTKGDIVRVEGTFFKACPEHGGDLDIHAKRIEILEQGHKIIRRVQLINIILPLVLFVIAVGLILFIFRKKL